MKKLFTIIAIVLFVGCSSNDNIVDDKIPEYNIDSYIQIDDMSFRSYIYEGMFYIESVDKKGNKIFTISDKAESYVHDKGFGEKKIYNVSGCYLLDALEKKDNIYILISLYSEIPLSHPHKFILKIKDGEIVNKVYFDSDDYHNHCFFPERMIDWYGEYMAIYITVKTSYNDMAILDENLNYTYNVSGHGVDRWVENIEKNNYILFSPNNIIYTVGNLVVCADMYKYEYTIWETKFTEEEIRLIKVDYFLEEDNAVIDVDAITKAGERKKFHLILNKNTGELLSNNVQ